MRKDLKTLNGKRFAFTAVVGRFGHKSGYKGQVVTILLTDIRLEGECGVITDHLWFTKGKSWAKCAEGDHVRFEARVTQYVKGYKGGCIDRMIERPLKKDYRLERPTKIKIVTRPELEDLTAIS